MPTIEFSKKDLEQLVGESMDEEELEQNLTRVKVEVEEIDGDRVEVETTSDRIDLLSVEGIARNLKSYLDIEPGLKKYNIGESGHKVKVEKVPVRPHVVTAVVKDIEMDKEAFESLIQLQEKIHGTFGRNRERVSIGVHDMEGIEFPCTYQAVKPSEFSFVPLEKQEEMNLEEILEEHEKGREYGDIISDADEWPLIVDSAGKVLSFPPIINGKITEVSEDSEDLFIDVTGTDLESVKFALNVIVTSLAEREGEIQKVEMADPEGNFLTPEFSTREIHVDLEEMRSITGIDLDKDKATEYLEKMGYGVIEIGEDIEAVIPPYRADILHEVDIAEDIAIGFGYNNIEPELPNISTIGEEDPVERFMHLVREVMTGLGYQEIMNPTLSNKETLIDLFGRDSDLVEIDNPVSENYTVCRDILMPQLLETLARNTHNRYPQKVFETADVVLKDRSKPQKARTDKHLSAVCSGKDVNLNSLREEVEGVLEALGIEKEIKETEIPGFIDGRCAEIIVDGESVGHIGEVHPRILNELGIEMPVSGFELDLSRIEA
ncbi:MAG: phenylalanine--tRNA ligase subunit beta [Candidatus Nanohaloarchaea archaeon]|nr:phenylalanine--tRNA ligase subunit beta [Candidatus Nanohaloarchaea archaeon]